MIEQFKIGDRVVKVRGYLFPGIIRSVFTNRRGEYRVVVECTALNADGMLHIFNLDQIRKRSAGVSGIQEEPGERLAAMGSAGTLPEAGKQDVPLERHKKERS